MTVTESKVVDLFDAISSKNRVDKLHTLEHVLDHSPRPRPSLLGELLHEGRELKLCTGECEGRRIGQSLRKGNDKNKYPYYKTD